MLDWLRDHRRRKLLEHPFPGAWREILRQNIVHFRHLDEQERAHLEQLVQVFVHEKQFVGCGGLELTDEVRVTIAGLACLLLIGLEHVLYRNVHTILVYPSVVMTPPRMKAIVPYVAIESPAVAIDGEAMLRGPVVLVWDAVRRGASHPEQGRNVVYHEFAHKLDMLDGTIDGTPPLPDREQYDRWVEVCTREYHELQRLSAAGHRTFIDSYGGTTVAEFFAVATETFFDQPGKLRKKHPALYSVLQEFYLQDPAAREERSAKNG